MQNIETRPMHGDEANQAYQFKALWEEGHYQYNPKDFHGPSLYYSSLPFVALSSANNHAELSKTNLRGLSVLFSLLSFIVIMNFHKLLGSKATLWALLFFAISPSFVFYARYYIQEPLLIFATLFFLYGLWRYSLKPHVKHVLSAGIGLGLMFATKETFIFSLVSLILALYLVNKQGFKAIKVKHLIIFSASALTLSFLLFSSFFKNPNSFVDAFTAYGHYASRAFGGTFDEQFTQGAGHEKPFYYYLQILSYQGETSLKSFIPDIWTNFKTRPLSEGIILLLALVGMISTFTKENLKHSKAKRILSCYAIFMFLIYSLIPYKTPWCLMNFHVAFIMLAGIGVSVLSDTFQNQKKQLLFFILLSLCCVDLVRQVHLQSKPDGIAAEEEYNPYAYSQTPHRFESELNKRLDFFISQHPKKYKMPIAVVTADNAAFLWYLRKFEKVGYYENHPVEAKKLRLFPLVLTAIDDKISHAALSESHSIDILAIRPNVFVNLYIQNEYWDKITGEQIKH